MFVGHYGVAFAVKTPRNKIPLWVLFVAVQLLDCLWAPFVLPGSRRCVSFPESPRLMRSIFITCLTHTA